MINIEFHSVETLPIRFSIFRKSSIQRTILLIFFLKIISGTSILFAQDTNSFSVNNKVIVKEEFDQQVNKMLAETNIPAISLAVINDGKIVYSNAYGHKIVNGTELADRNTLFEACSLSKSFMVYVTNKMVDENKLDLDKPLYKYLNYPLLEKDPRYKLITARMVLGHSSGIENWKSNNNPDVLEIIADPGTEYVYSGEGYQYLAKVIEHLRKESYQEYIEKMIIKPLDLKRTFMMFNPGWIDSANYARGHGIYGKEIKKNKNTNPIPASGMHLTAADYAKLIIALFDSHRFSEHRIKDMLNPVIKEHLDNPSLFYGPGFEILRNDKDTLIMHGGDNWGYKGFVCYSIKHKSGLVFLANSDRGKYLTKKLCEMTVGFDIDAYFDNDYRTQYPSSSITFLNIYEQGGADKMYARLLKTMAENPAVIGEKNLNELGRLFFFENNALSRKLLNKSLELYPKSAFGYYLLASLDMNEKDYHAAYPNLLKAKELNYTNDPVDVDIKYCEGKMKEK